MSDYLLTLDIGTTTISAAVLDRDKNIVVASDFTLNDQTQFGDNIISRIDFALKSPANKEILQNAVFSSINRVLKRLLSYAGLRRNSIKGVFCVCNTAMHHIFLGIDPKPLITPPYKSRHNAKITISAKDTAINLENSCPITFLPNIGGFVGSDALAVIMASGIYKSDSLCLVIDIGTNGEIILGDKNFLFVASTAAGPAFEAGQISCGMPAVEGAIEAVRIYKNTIKYKVIGRGKPKGICGSGLIDLVAAIVKAGILKPSGRLLAGSEYVVYKKGRRKISITQQDIRKLQLAKAAIAAAIKILLKISNKKAQQVKKVIVTGRFGNIMNTDSIIDIGIIPHTCSGNVEFLKNGAMEGLRLYLVRKYFQNNINLILGKTRHIPLLGKGFANEFVSSLSIAPY